MKRVTGSVRAHPWRSFAGIALLVIAGAAFYSRDLIGLALTADQPIDLTLPLVQPLTPGPGEVVYRIDANQSEATVAVKEVLAGVDHDVELTTQGIAGDLGVTASDARSARLGEIQVDVHQLTSDNRLRDKAIEHEYLESHDHHTVRLHDTKVTRIDQAAGSQSAKLTIEGQLEVKAKSHPVRLKVDARLDGDTLTATAESTISMAEFGVGPITKVGLVQTEDEARITLHIVAVDGRKFTPPTALSLVTSVRSATGGGPSYSKDIQPILEANCASCHNTGAIGARMLTLDTAGDAAEVADGLAVVTRTKYMPPWPPSNKGVPLQHPRGLDDKEIGLIDRWAAAGGRLDVPDNTRIKAPDTPEVKEPDADVVLKMAEPYEGDGTKADDYRCFLMDPGFTESQQITGYKFTPGSLEVVHHVLVYKVTAAARQRVEARDAAEPGPGFSCGDSVGMSTGGSALVGGWVPGSRPRDFGEGVGLPMGAGDILVTQIHYHYEGILRPDQSTMTLELADDPATVRSLHPTAIASPVEIPCPAESANGPLCDRNAALAAKHGGIIANVLHRMCGTTPEELAAKSDGWTAATECTYPVSENGQVVDFLGHMHELGSSYTMTLNKGRPGETVLLDIPVWNFSWQLNYQPVKPVHVERGDTLTVECTWDRSLRYDPEPRYIFFAEGTKDEMCFSTITVLPDE